MIAYSIKFTMKDGSTDWYDSVDLSSLMAESNETHYILRGDSYPVYEVDRTLVESVAQYPVCELCGGDLRGSSCHLPPCKTGHYSK